MKILFVTAGCACFGASVFSGPIADRTLPPVERLAAVEHAPLKLVEDGKLNLAIVGEFKKEAAVRGPEGQTLALKARDSVRRGANVIAEALEKCTGMKPVICEPDDPKVSGYPYVIALGKTELSASLGMKPDKLPREGFEIRTFDKGVVIAGMDGFAIPGFYDRYNWRTGRLTCNGTEWGAADFVERFLRVRKFSLKDKGLWEFFPPCRKLTLKPAAYRDHPRFIFRGANHENWRVAISTDFFGGEAPNPMVLAKAHPDKLEEIFYRDASGRLWQDSETYLFNYFDVTNPKLADILINDFRQYYDSDGKDSYWGHVWAPSSRYIWFGQCDRGLIMDTPRAKSFPRADAIPCDVMSEIYGEFYRVLGEKALKAFPDKTLVLMAYSNYLRAPRLFSKLPPNVHMLACAGTPALVRSAAYRRDVIDIYEGWNRMMPEGRKCVPYTYDLSYNSQGLIPQTLRGYFEGEYMRAMAPHIAQNLVYPCNYLHGRGNYLSAYLTYRCLWNPDYDVDAGLADYFNTTCGEDAGRHLVAFYRLLLDGWVKGYVPEIKSGWGSIPAPDFKLLGKAFPEPTVKKLIALLGAAEKSLPADDAKSKARFEDFRRPFSKALLDLVAQQKISFPDLDAEYADCGMKIDGAINEPAWKRMRLPTFKRAFAGGDMKVVNPESRLLWNDNGLYLAVKSPSPYKVGSGLWDGDSFEFMVTGGDPNNPANLYQFVLTPSGKFEDYQMQIDQPRSMDVNFVAKGAEYAVNTNADEWAAELFVPWSAFYDAAPKAGDIRKINLISNRRLPEEEYSSWSPTLNNNRRHEMYAPVMFKAPPAALSSGWKRHPGMPWVFVAEKSVPAKSGDTVTVSFSAEGRGRAKALLFRYDGAGKWNGNSGGTIIDLKPDGSSFTLKLQVEEGKRPTAEVYPAISLFPHSDLFSL
ncbi:MAG: DUF4838 domain-containing protein [Kiritimatiellae bacterium]|nr:DUF4838 domain-containing protein [Kiritimatiellia bacterium]MDD4621749.1 DUF4838 domain-containing protein [Kiritimatiellia bacterium]